MKDAVDRNIETIYRNIQLEYRGVYPDIVFEKPITVENKKRNLRNVIVSCNKMEMEKERRSRMSRDELDFTEHSDSAEEDTKFLFDERGRSNMSLEEVKEDQRNLKWSTDYIDYLIFEAHDEYEIRELNLKRDIYLKEIGLVDERAVDELMYYKFSMGDEMY